MGQSFGHYPVEVHLWDQVLHANLDSDDAILLGDDADIGSAHPIFLSSFPRSVVIVIIHKVGTSQLLKVVFGVVGLAIRFMVPLLYGPFPPAPSPAPN